MRTSTQEGDLRGMSGGESISVTLTNSLWVDFDLSVRRQGLTTDGVLIHLIDAFPDLSIADLRELDEPRKERANRNLTLRIGRQRKIAIERLAFDCGFSTSSLFRRILHAFFVSHEIAFFHPQNGTGIQLARAQMHFNFAKDYERR